MIAAIDVTCPTCGARPGSACTAVDLADARLGSDPHPARAEVARSANGIPLQPTGSSSRIVRERERVDALLDTVHFESEGDRRAHALGILRLLREARTIEREAAGRFDHEGMPFDFDTVRGFNRAWASQQGPTDERTHPVAILMRAIGGVDLWRGLIEEVNTLAWLARHLLDCEGGLSDEADGAFTSAVSLIQAKAAALQAFSMREGWEEPRRSSMSGPPRSAA